MRIFILLTILCLLLPVSVLAQEVEETGVTEELEIVEITRPSVRILNTDNFLIENEFLRTYAGSSADHWRF